MHRVDWNSQNLTCICGKKVDITDLYDTTVNGLDGVYDRSSNNEVVSCTCGMKYKVGLKLEMTPNIVDSFVDPIKSNFYYDKNDKLVSPAYFEMLQADDPVNLWDGEYECNGQIYKVVDSKVFYILSAAIDPNQMDIFEMEGAIV